MQTQQEIDHLLISSHGVEEEFQPSAFSQESPRSPTGSEQLQLPWSRFSSQPCAAPLWAEAKVSIAPCSSSVAQGLWLFDKARADNVLSTSTEQREAQAAASTAMRPVGSRAQGDSTLMARFPRLALGKTLSGRSTCPGGKPSMDNSEAPGFAPKAKETSALYVPLPAAQSVLMVTVENSRYVLVATEPVL